MPGIGCIPDSTGKNLLDQGIWISLLGATIVAINSTTEKLIETVEQRMNVFQLNTREQLYLFCDTLNHHEFLSFFFTFTNGQITRAFLSFYMSF